MIEGMTMALLMNANRNGVIEEPAIVANWNSVKEAAQHLAHYCASEMHAGGSYILLST